MLAGAHKKKSTLSWNEMHNVLLNESCFMQYKICNSVVYVSVYGHIKRRMERYCVSMPPELKLNRNEIIIQHRQLKIFCDT